MKIKLFLISAFLMGCILIFSAEGSKRKLTVDIKTGKYYEFNYKAGPAGFKIVPQIAIWLTDAKGDYIDTIYVTKKSAKSDWGMPGVNRPSSLPVWSHNRGIKSSSGFYMPDKKNPLPDSQTGATPKGSFVKTWELPQNLVQGLYIINVEVNSSFDFNAKFRKDLPKDDPSYNEYSGQPSLLWSAKININETDKTVNFEKIGYGHPSGKSGEVFKDLSVLTTALNIIDSITAKIDSK